MAMASRMAQMQSKAALAAKMAQIQSKASEATKLAAKHASAVQSEAARLAAEHGGALQSKAAEAASFAAKHGSELHSKASEATRTAAKQGWAYHKTVMERNKHYVVDPPTAEKCRELSKQLFYTRIASIPSRYESFWKEIDGAKLLLKNRQDLKIEHAGVAALFGIELYAWLCAGEFIGRGFTLSGYHV